MRSWSGRSWKCMANSHARRPAPDRSVCGLAHAQAERWGAELHMEDVEFVDTSVRPFVVRTSEREVTTLLPNPIHQCRRGVSSIRSLTG